MQSAGQFATKGAVALGELAVAARMGVEDPPELFVAAFHLEQRVHLVQRRDQEAVCGALSDILTAVEPHMPPRPPEQPASLLRGRRAGVGDEDREDPPQRLFLAQLHASCCWPAGGGEAISASSTVWCAI